MENRKYVMLGSILILAGLFLVSSLHLHGWPFGGRSSGSTEAPEGEHEGTGRGREGRSSGEPPEGVRGQGGSREGSSGQHDTSREGDEGRSPKEKSRSGIDLTEESTLKKPVKLDRAAAKEIEKLSQGSMGEALRAFKGQIEDLRTERESRSWFGKGPRDTFVLDVLDRVAKKREVKGQDLVDMRQSLSKFTDYVEKLGNPASDLDPQVRQDLVESVRSAYDGDLGRGMRNLALDLGEAFGKLPLEGSGVDPREIREMRQGLRRLSNAVESAEAFKRSAIGSAKETASDFRKSMKEKFDAFKNTLKRILQVIAVIAAVITVAVLIKYIVIAVSVAILVGVIGAIAYGCWKAPNACGMALKGGAKGAMAVGRGVGRMASAAEAHAKDFK